MVIFNKGIYNLALEIGKGVLALSPFVTLKTGLSILPII